MANCSFNLQRALPVCAITLAPSGPVARTGSLRYRRLIAGGPLGHADTRRICNPRHGRLPACDWRSRRTFGPAEAMRIGSPRHSRLPAGATHASAGEMPRRSADFQSAAVSRVSHLPTFRDCSASVGIERWPAGSRRYGRLETCATPSLAIPVPKRGDTTLRYRRGPASWPRRQWRP